MRAQGRKYAGEGDQRDEKDLGDKKEKKKASSFFPKKGADLPRKTVDEKEGKRTGLVRVGICLKAITRLLKYFTKKLISVLDKKPEQGRVLNVR